MDIQEAIELMGEVKEFVQDEEEVTDITKYSEACGVAIQALKNEQKRLELIEKYKQRASMAWGYRFNEFDYKLQALKESEVEG